MRRKIGLIVTLACLLCSCAIEEVPTVGGYILAEMEADHTRTSVTDEGRFTWTSGDQVWLHTTTGGVVGTLSSGAGSSSARFSYESFIGDLTGRAVYPYNEGHSISGDVLEVLLPSSYDLGQSLTNTNAVMYGENVDGVHRFSHLAGLMRFSFKNVPAGTDKFTLTLDRKVNGVFSVDLNSASPMVETEDSGLESEKSVTLCFDPLAETSDMKLYVPLPVGSYSTLGLALYKGEETVWTYSNTVINTISRKTLKLMPTVTLSGVIDGDMEDGSSTDDVPQINNPSIIPKAPDEPIKILCFGSSWFLNTWWYLNKITHNLGINAEIHGYYVGHSCFDEWIALYNNDLSPFEGSESTRQSYRYVSVNGENYKGTRRVEGGDFGNQEFRDAWYEDLVSEEWDVIAFQQGAHQAPQWKYWENGDEIVSIIKRHCAPNTMIAFNSTWTPSVNSKYLPDDTDGQCSMTLEGQKLWQTMNYDNCKRFMSITGIDNVSPNGAMMYTLRRDQYMNTDGDDLCYDGIHPNYGLPMFAIASVFYETFVAPYYGKSIKECTWLPESSDKRGPFNNSVFRPISGTQRDRIYEYVRLSLSNRFAFNEPYPYYEEDEWTRVEGVEVMNTMPQKSGYVKSNSGLVTEYIGYDWAKYEIRVTCRCGTNDLMYAGCLWGENDVYLGGFWKSDGSAKVFDKVILTDDILPEGVSWSDVVKIGLSSTTSASGNLRYSVLEVR